MSTEIELKLFFSPLQQQALVDCINNIAKKPPQSSKQLINRYYDTFDLQLRRWNMGLRVRDTNGEKEQTIKTSGQVRGGLHQRAEYNVAINKAAPELGLFPQAIWPQGADIDSLQGNLQCLFNTNFNRLVWHINIDESLIELAIDIGAVETANATEAICELELELLTGHSHSLLMLANLIAQQIPVRLAQDSKAKRGYVLANLSPSRLASDLQQHYQQFIELAAINTNKDLMALLEQSLQLWLVIDKQVEVYVGEQHDSNYNNIDKINSVELLSMYKVLFSKLITLETDASGFLRFLPSLEQDLFKIKPSAEYLLISLNQDTGLQSTNNDITTATGLIALRDQMDFGLLQLLLLRLYISATESSN